VMMNHSLKSLCNLAQGTAIRGKWHGQHYTVIKQLGYGANGVVYLVRTADGQAALKMSDNASSITSEVNVLKSFTKVQGSALGPSLLDVDDWEQSGGQTSFYVMEFIKGPDLLSFIKQKGHDWLGVLILQLLSDLEDIHTNGWVFGDLKPENLIVTGPPPRVRCIDVGGTTLKGRAIKEFTEFFDRGYWGLGSRKADETYDLFAVAMVMINTAYPKRFAKKGGGLDQLMPLVRQSELAKYAEVIEGALTGRYQSASEMRSSILQVLQPARKKRAAAHSKRAATRTARGAGSQQKKSGGFGETLLIIAVISMLYFFYIYVQIL
jgi:serine/threonine protein kinase